MTDEAQPKMFEIMHTLLVYRETFPTTIKEAHQAPPGELRKVVLGTSICIVIAIVIGSIMRETGKKNETHTSFSYLFCTVVGPTKPHTYNNPEWDAAKKEHLLKQRSNPITGISSKYAS